MDQKGSLDYIWPVLWRPALVGIACGALFGLASTFNNSIWQNESCNTNLALLINLPPIAIVLLLVLLSAFLAVIFTRGYIKKPTEALLPGAVAGVAFIPAAFSFGGLLMPLVMLSPLFVTKEPGVYNMFDLFLMDPVGHIYSFYSVGAVYMAVYSFIAMAITSAIAAAYTFMVQRQPGGEKEVKSTNIVTIAFILSMIVLVIVAPPAIAYVGLNMGWIEGSFHDYMDCIRAERTAEDAIAINYTGGPNLRFDRDMPFTIEVAGADNQLKNATNVDAIGQSGLAAAISPDHGLKSEKGASVVLSGSDIKNPAHVVIVAHMADGSSMVMWDTYL